MEQREVTCPRCGSWHVLLRVLVDERGKLSDDGTLLHCVDCHFEAQRKAARLFAEARRLTPKQVEALRVLRLGDEGVTTR